MVVMRIVCSKQKQYIAVSEKYTEVLNEFSTALRTEVVKSDAWIRALFVIAGSKMDKTAGNIFRKTAGMKNPHL